MPDRERARGGQQHGEGGEQAGEPGGLIDLPVDLSVQSRWRAARRRAASWLSSSFSAFCMAWLAPVSAHSRAACGLTPVAIFAISRAKFWNCAARSENSVNCAASSARIRICHSATTAPMRSVSDEQAFRQRPGRGRVAGEIDAARLHHHRIDQAVGAVDVLRAGLGGLEFVGQATVMTRVHDRHAASPTVTVASSAKIA